MKKILAILLAAALALSLCAVLADGSEDMAIDLSEYFSKRDLSGEWDVDGAQTIRLDGQTAVSIGANFNMKSLKLTADEFEPAIAYRFYTSALSAITNLTVGAQIAIDAEKNLSLKITSDLDKQFNTILKNLVNKELGAFINEAKKQITAKLDEQTGGVTGKISQFVNLENGINAQSLNMDALNKQLNSKKAELQRQLEKQAAGAVGGAAGDAVG